MNTKQKGVKQKGQKVQSGQSKKKYKYSELNNRLKHSDKDSPDVEGDWHQRVEDNDVGPEEEKHGEGEVGVGQAGQERCEGFTVALLPKVVPHSEECAQQCQETKDLVGGGKS